MKEVYDVINNGEIDHKFDSPNKFTTTIPQMKKKEEIKLLDDWGIEIVDCDVELKIKGEKCNLSKWIALTGKYKNSYIRTSVVLTLIEDGIKTAYGHYKLVNRSKYDYRYFLPKGFVLGWEEEVYNYIKEHLMTQKVKLLGEIEESGEKVELLTVDAEFNKILNDKDSGVSKLLDQSIDNKLLIEEDRGIEVINNNSPLNEKEEEMKENRTLLSNEELKKSSLSFESDIKRFGSLSSSRKLLKRPSNSFSLDSKHSINSTLVGETVKEDKEREYKHSISEDHLLVTKELPESVLNDKEAMESIQNTLKDLPFLEQRKQACESMMTKEEIDLLQAKFKKELDEALNDQVDIKKNESVKDEDNEVTDIKETFINNSISSKSSPFEDSLFIHTKKEYFTDNEDVPLIDDKVNSSPLVPKVVDIEKEEKSEIKGNKKFSILISKSSITNKDTLGNNDDDVLVNNDVIGGNEILDNNDVLDNTTLNNNNEILDNNDSEISGNIISSNNTLTNNNDVPSNTTIANDTLTNNTTVNTEIDNNTIVNTEIANIEIDNDVSVINENGYKQIIVKTQEDNNIDSSIKNISSCTSDDKNIFKEDNDLINESKNSSKVTNKKVKASKSTSSVRKKTKKVCIFRNPKKKKTIKKN